MSPITGRCLCGGIRFEIDGPLAAIQVCHCGQCRRAQGAPLASNIPVPVPRFRWIDGQALLSAYESSPGKERCFCSRCGSPVFSRRVDDPHTLRVRAGILEGPLDSRPVAHFHVASMANWWTLDDTLPRFEAGYVPP